ncbi:MAG TPA: hypothetical protein VFH08_03990 [Chitinophagaceae bacterium]|nr:hypothetical protein [Chitinophagaceae bacterium]
MKRIYNFISSKNAAVLFTIIAILCRIINILYASFVNRDKIFLAMQSKNFLGGKGLSVPQYFSADINNPVYNFTPNWPPGYPILLSPFLKIFNYDVYRATTTLEIIFCIAFIFLVRKIAFDLKLPMAPINILTLIAGCFNYEFITQSLPTDSPSFVIFIFGLYLLLRTIQNARFELTKLVVVALMLFLPCTFRYSYPPLSVAAFIAVIFAGVYLKKNMLIKKGLVSLAFFSFLLICFLALLKSTTGATGYIVETARGFFPEQLLEWAPIGPGAFIDTVFTTSQLIRLTGISVGEALMLLEIINAIMIISVCFVLIDLFFRKKFFKSLDSFRWFILIGFFISVATCVSLGYLSVTYRPQPGWGNYLGEPRYFSFVTFYLQVIFVGWVFLFPSWKRNFLKRLVVFVFSLLLFTEIMHNIYFNTKLVINFNKYKAANFEDPDYVYFSKMCTQLIRDNPDSEILVISDGDEFFRLMASYLGQKGVYDGFNFIKSIPEVEKKTILIIALYDNEMIDYRGFLSLQNAKLINKVNGVNFYRIDLLPE